VGFNWSVFFGLFQSILTTIRIRSEWFRQDRDELRKMIVFVRIESISETRPWTHFVDLRKNTQKRSLP
jgi:hypothetical protein